MIPTKQKIILIATLYISSLCISSLYAMQKEDNTQLFDKITHAIEQGSLTEVKQLIDHQNVNIKDQEDTTPLMIAIVHDQLPIVQYLIAQGAQVNAQTKDGVTPLLIAAQRSLPIVKLLIENNANIHAQDNAGGNVLANALLPYDGMLDFEKVKYVLDHGADVNTKMKDGTTPLLVLAEYYSDPSSYFNAAQGAAIAQGFIPLVEYLIQHNADVNASAEVYHKKRTPLLFALQKNNAPLIHYLVTHGANTHIVDEYGRTPLMFAAAHGDLALVKLLITMGADLTAKDKDGTSVMEYAKDSSEINNYLKTEMSKKSQ